MPKFSIIIPVYNVAPYLRECLDSVLAQTFAEWEAICVDDGSTDGSGAILDEYAARDSRFRVFHKENGGVSSARNLALDNMKGEWVWFVDGDDEIAYDSLEFFSKKTHCLTVFDCIKFAVKRGVDGLTPDTLNFNSLNKDAEEVYIMGEVVQREKFLKGMHLSISCNFLWGHSLLKKIRFQKYSLSEDTLFAHSAALGARMIVVVPYIAYFYRERVGSAVLTVSKTKVIDRTNALNDLVQILKEHKEYKYARFFLDREWFLQGLLWAFKIDSAPSRLEAIRYWMSKTTQLDSSLQTFRLRILRIVYFVFGAWGVQYLLYCPILRILNRGI